MGTFVTEQNRSRDVFCSVNFSQGNSRSFCLLSKYIIPKEILPALVCLEIAQCHIVYYYKNKCLSVLRNLLFDNLETNLIIENIWMHPAKSESSW